METYPLLCRCFPLISSINHTYWRVLTKNRHITFSPAHKLAPYVKLQKIDQDVVIMKTELLEKLASQISQLMPQSGGEDLKKNIQQVLARQLNKLDVVSRDEFDAQQAVLLRTREKLEALEKTVKELEDKLS